MGVARLGACDVLLGGVVISPSTNQAALVHFYLRVACKYCHGSYLVIITASFDLMLSLI